MSSDDRHVGFILDVFDVLERHGYHQYDNQHTDRAFGMILDLASVYEGARETTLARHSPRRIPATPPGPGAGKSAIILTPAEVSAVFAAADIAAAQAVPRACARLLRPVRPDGQTHLRDAEASTG